MNIKIIFFLPDLEGGGAERVTLNIINQLDRKIFDVYLVVGDKTGDLINQLPKETTIIGLNSKKTIFSLIPFYFTCKKIQPDLIFSTLNRTNIVSIIVKLLINTKVVIREPNMPSNQIKLLPKFMLILIKFLYPKSDNIIAQTNEMKDEMIGYYALHRSKINVMVNPINIMLIEKSIKDDVNPFPSNQINLIAIGSIIYRKGFDVLINALKEVVSSFNNVHLYILGKGIEEENLKKLTLEVCLSDNIHFLGFQENPYKYLKHADLFVLSSRAEGLPNVVLESLYLKTKVVATDCVPYVKNLLEENDFGEVVNVDDVQDLSHKILTAINRNDYNILKDFNSSDFNSYFRGIVKNG